MTKWRDSRAECGSEWCGRPGDRFAGNLMDDLNGQADIIVANLVADLILKLTPAIPAA